MELIQSKNNVISKDGTKIAFVKQGEGPALILVAAATADHTDAEQLAARLAGQFTVYNFDRRGRGGSNEASPYAIDREVEDIHALIKEAGGSAFLFGSSSGAVLALEAASKLGSGVNKLFLYEPPFIVDESRPPVSPEYVNTLNRLVAEGDRSGAVEYFMTEAVGVPGEYIEFMKADPSWDKMSSMAHTLAYDGQIMGSTQSGQPLPADRWKVSIPVSVTSGENSPPFLHEAAKALADLLEQGEYRMLEGQDHSAVMMAPEALAAEIGRYFLG